SGKMPLTAHRASVNLFSLPPKGKDLRGLTAVVALNLGNRLTNRIVGSTSRRAVSPSVVMDATACAHESIHQKLAKLLGRRNRAPRRPFLFGPTRSPVWPEDWRKAQTPCSGLTTSSAKPRVAARLTPRDTMSDPAHAIVCRPAFGGHGRRPQ